jgi:hypothetical protein
VENGRRDEPHRRGGPQPNAALRSEHPDAESDAEEQLNKPNIANDVLIKETRVDHTWDELILHQWSDEHKKSIYREKYAVEHHHFITVHIFSTK